LSTPFSFPPVGNVIALWFSLIGMVVLVPICILVGRTRRRPVWLARGLAFVCMSLLGMLLSSCSGGGGMNGGGGTPAGTYNLMVTGTFSSGTTTLSNAVQLTLVVK
jgi:hypothetical protein